MIRSRTATVDGLGLHWLEAGEDRPGPPVLLVHGWPTSSFLWRNVMPGIARSRRVLALDLPGFGRSDKPLDASYSFRFYARVIEGFLAGQGIDRLGLVVHDLGGPVGLYWASQQPAGRVERLGLLNTVVYPELHWAVKVFTASCRVPGVRSLVSRPTTLRTAMWWGVGDRRRLASDAVAGVCAPFADAASREALVRTGRNLHPEGFREVGRWWEATDVPVWMIWGRRDWYRPDIATTAARVAARPGAEVTELPEAGHFLQEERGEEVGEMLGEFFGR